MLKRTIHIQNYKPLQILLHPLRRGHVVLLLEGGVEDGLALEAGVGCLGSRSSLTGRSGADSQRKQLLFLVDFKKMLFFYIKR